MCGECVTIEYSAPKQNAITKVQETFWKQQWREYKCQRSWKGAMKCCLPDTSWLPWSWTHSGYGYSTRIMRAQTYTHTCVCTYTRCECGRESSWEKERVQREWDREGKSKYKINKYKIILKNWRKGDSQKGLVASKSTSIHPLWEILIYFHLCFVVDRTEIQYNCDCESWLKFLCPCLDVSPSLLWWIYGDELCNAMPKTSHSIWFWYRKL